MIGAGNGLVWCPCGDMGSAHIERAGAFEETGYRALRRDDLSGLQAVSTREECSLISVSRAAGKHTDLCARIFATSLTPADQTAAPPGSRTALSWWQGEVKAAKASSPPCAGRRFQTCARSSGTRSCGRFRSRARAARTARGPRP